MQTNLFTGIIPALFTAYDDRGDLDQGRQARLIGHLIGSGVHGLFVGGSTGEFALLSLAERERLAEQAIAEAGKAVPVIVHAGAFDTRSAVQLARHARKAGASAVSSLPPLYYQPSEETILQHYREIGAAAGLPFYIYHMPSRTGVRMTERLAQRLLEIPNLAGMKFSHGNLHELWQFLEWTGGKVPVLSGYDELLLPALVLGTVGAIGSTYNFMAAHFLALWAAWKGEDLQRARELQLQANRVIDVTLRWDNSLSAGKAALEALGLGCGEPRPPLRRFTAEEKRALTAELAKAGLPVTG
ncbi:MAG: dihydrodipicolinate synthase family protein [Planctomycetes bacterium]|nr:dihydrodipicolinate synthase family protein [Planctomycetota bacterium]